MASRRRADGPAIEQVQALVAILNDKTALTILREQGWYRISVASAPRRWPPEWVAFYQTRVFEQEAYAVRYYGRVDRIDRVQRHELFPNEIASIRTQREYYRIALKRLETFEQPIVSQPRRVTFIATTWDKLSRAKVLKDL